MKYGLIIIAIIFLVMILGKMQIPLVGGLKSDLLALYEFNETSGSTFYDSKGSYNITAGTGMLGYSGKMGNGLYAPGTAYASTSSIPINRQNISIAFWVNVFNCAEYYETSQYMFRDANYKWYGVMQGADEYGTYNIRINGSQVNGNISKGGWVHIAITRGATNTVKFYVNGTYDSQTTIYITQDTSTWFFGETDYDYPYELKFDQFAFWNRELSAAEIAQIYNSGNGLAYTNWT